MLSKPTEKEDSSNLVEEESKQLQVEAQRNSTKKSIKSIGMILLLPLLFSVIIIHINCLINRKHPFGAEAACLVCS